LGRTGGRGNGGCLERVLPLVGLQDGTGGPAVRLGELNQRLRAEAAGGCRGGLRGREIEPLLALVAGVGGLVEGEAGLGWGGHERASFWFDNIRVRVDVLAAPEMVDPVLRGIRPRVLVQPISGLCFVVVGDFPNGSRSGSSECLKNLWVLPRVNTGNLCDFDAVLCFAEMQCGDKVFTLIFGVEQCDEGILFRP
jgi:hypothetical protein